MSYRQEIVGKYFFIGCMWSSFWFLKY